MDKTLKEIARQLQHIDKTLNRILIQLEPIQLPVRVKYDKIPVDMVYDEIAKDSNKSE